MVHTGMMVRIVSCEKDAFLTLARHSYNLARNDAAAKESVNVLVGSIGVIIYEKPWKTEDIFRITSVVCHLRGSMSTWLSRGPDEAFLSQGRK